MDVGHAPIAARLLEAGATLDPRDPGSTLNNAVWKGSAPVVATLLEHGADPNASAVLCSCVKNIPALDPLGESDADGPYCEILRLLLKAKADPNLLSPQATVALVHVQNEWAARRLLDHGARFDWRDPAGMSLLSVAMKQALCEETVQLLLKLGADPDVESSDGTTPLITALQDTSYTPAIEDLLDHGADPERTDTDGTTALVLAVRKGWDRAVKKLLEVGADSDRAPADQPPPIVQALNARKILPLLIEAGADHAGIDSAELAGCLEPLEAQRPEPKPELGGWIGAMLRRDLAAVRSTLQAGAGIDDEVYGVTPLMLAAQLSHPGLVTLLLELGADPDGGRPSPLSCALQSAVILRITRASVVLEKDVRPRMDVVEKLVEAGAQVSYSCLLLSRRVDGQPQLFDYLVGRCADPAAHGLLHSAAEKGDVAFLKRLLALGVGPAVRDEEGQTPLHGCARKGYYRRHLEAARTLFDHGAPVDATDDRGNTPLHSLCSMTVVSRQSVEFARWLLEAGANVNHQNSAGRTPLMRLQGMYRVYRFQIAQLLLAAGADPDLACREGFTALDLAQRATSPGALLGLLHSVGAKPGKSRMALALEAYLDNDDARPLKKLLKQRFRVTPHADVIDLIAGHLELPLDVEQVFGSPQSFQALFGKLGAKPFPAVIVGGDGLGTDFWLVLESARIISLHHDATFSEVAHAIRVRSAAKFMQAFTRQGSLCDLRQLVGLNAGLKMGRPTKKEQRANLVCIARVFGVPNTVEAVRRLLTPPAAEWLRACVDELTD